MHLQTLSWSVVSTKNNAYVKPAIQIFGKDNEGRSVYVRLPALSTSILAIEDELDDNEIDKIDQAYQPSNYSTSLLRDNLILLRNPLNTNIEEVIGAEKDPQGLLTSFWQATNITPYGWIYIEQYEIISKKVSNCDLEIRTKEEFIVAAESDFISSNTFFWDIEVYSPDRNFTDPSILSHEIFMISVVTEIDEKVTAYILTTKNTDTFPEAIFIKYAEEKDLLIGFFTLWQEAKPDRVINYNGDSYDMPYIIERAKLLKIKIPALGKLLFPSTVVRESHPSPLGYEYDKTLFTPGVEKLDLITYFRRFYPGHENYRLETIGQLYLGEGKSGLEIEEMFKIIEANDAKKMKEVAYYSYKDAILLYELWTKLSIERDINRLCDAIFCTADELLRLKEKDLITRLCYTVDFAIVTIIGEIGKQIDYLLPFKNTVYRNLYVYDYERLFDLALEMDELEYSSLIKERIEYLPTHIKAMVIYSSYVPLTIRDNFKSLLEDAVAIDNNYLYSYQDNLENLFLVDKYDYLFVITQSSMIIYKNGIFIRQGLHKLTRPKYQYLKIAVDQYLLDYINRKKVLGRRVTAKDLEKIDNNLFIISDKIKPTTSYKDIKNIRYQLSESLTKENVDIKTWVNVRYIYSTDGIKVINNDITNYQLDYKFYVKDINDAYKTLDSIIK